MKKQHALRKTGKAELGLLANPVAVKAAVLQLDDISAAINSLPELDESTPSRASHTKEVTVKSNKMKHKTAVKEAEHLKLVLQHPAYQSDPLATIRMHLENTIGKQRR